jgi:tetratricopeptide (TPR) repeat protein
MGVVVKSKMWLVALALLSGVVTNMHAQPVVASAVELGDREVRTRRPAAALVHYESALAEAPSSFELLWRVSAALIDVSEFDTNAARRKAAFTRAAELARQATAIKPNDAAGHFHLARALGREALSVSARERTKYALDVRSSALRALSIDSSHAGALHVMGRWHAEVMRLNSITRMVARTFMGGKVFGEASWANAVSLLERANAIEPNRTVHQLALAQIYRDTGKKDRARAMYEAAIKSPLYDANDEAYKREAQKELGELK